MLFNETAIAMLFVVVVVILLLGGFSGQLSSTLGQSGQVLASVGDGKLKASQVAQAPEAASTSTAVVANTRLEDILIRFGIFSAVIFAFTAYSVVVFTRVESNKANPPEKKGDHRNSNAALADLLLDRRSEIGRAIRNTSDAFDTSKLTVEIFMTPNPVTARVNEKLDKVIELMTGRGFRHMMILDSHDKLVGIISDRDLVGIAGKSISEVMTPDPFFIDATSPVSIAITMLVTNRISAMPVVHDEKVVGILTRSDLLVTLQCLMLNVQERSSGV